MTDATTARAAGADRAMRRSYVRVLLVWLATLAGLYILQWIFS